MSRAALAAAPLAVLGLPTLAHAQGEGTYEAAVFGVNDFGQAGRCPGYADLHRAVDAMNIVRSRLAGGGYTVSSTNNANEGTDGRDFIDTSHPSGLGRDSSNLNGTDWADVVFYSGHGYRVHNNNATSFSAIVMGDDDELVAGLDTGCEPNTLEHLRMGSSNGDANILILHACQSMQRSVWNDGAYWSTFVAPPFSMFMGYQGIMYHSTDSVNRLGDYVTSSQSNGLGAEWVDQLTDLDLLESNEDQCATIMVAGSSDSQCRDQYNNAGFKDYHQPSSYLRTTYHYWCSCDADQADPLPGC